MVCGLPTDGRRQAGDRMSPTCSLSIELWIYGLASGMSHLRVQYAGLATRLVHLEIAALASLN